MITNMYIHLHFTDILTAFLSLDVHLWILVNELNQIQSRWYDLGVQLGISVGTLSSIQTHPQLAASGLHAQLRQMLTHWLQGEGVPATWEKLIAALATPTISQKKLAKSLETKYCSRDQGMYIDQCC